MERIAQALQPLIVEYVLYAMIGTILCVTLILFVVLIVQKLRIERRERTLGILQGRYSTAISKRLLDADLKIDKPASAIEFEAMGNALVDLGVTIAGPMTAQLRTIARETGMDGYYLDMAASDSWTKRFQAIEKLGFLRFSELEPFYNDLLAREKDLHVRTKTIWALSLIASRETLPRLNRFLGDPLFASGKFNEYVYTNVIGAFRERGEEDEFVVWLGTLRDDETVPALLKKDIIEACGATHLSAATGIILDFHRLFRDDGAMKIACIRALENLGATEAGNVIAAGLKDPDWRVRAVAAKNADVCIGEIVGALEEVLHDKSYQVRINAAQSLSRLGEGGLSALRRGTMSDDRFVRDVSNYMIGEKLHA